MVKTGYSELTSKLCTCFLGASSMHFAFILTSVIVAVLSDSDDCEGPVRAWLITSACVPGFLLVFYLWKPFIVTCIWFVWHLVWSIVGAFWIAKGECHEDFQSGYCTGISIIVVNFAIVALMMGISCLFSIAMCVGYGLTARYQEMKK